MRHFKDLTINPGRIKRHRCAFCGVINDEFSLRDAAPFHGWACWYCFEKKVLPARAGQPAPTERYVMTTKTKRVIEQADSPEDLGHTIFRQTATGGVRGARASSDQSVMTIREDGRYITLRPSSAIARKMEEQGWGSVVLEWRGNSDDKPTGVIVMQPGAGEHGITVRYRSERRQERTFIALSAKRFGKAVMTTGAGTVGVCKEREIEGGFWFGLPENLRFEPVTPPSQELE
jgi:hypothetical protein